jgi:hypothetical protein
MRTKNEILDHAYWNFDPSVRFREYLSDILDEYTLSIIPPKYEDNKERPLSVFETTFNMVVDQMREKVNGK